MRGQIKSVIFEVIAIFLVTLIIVIFSYFFFSSIYEMYPSVSLLYDFDNISNDYCAGLDLLTTSFCLRTEVDSMYNYNLSNVGKKLNITSLRIEGGVCSHYSEYYVKRARQLGFKSRTVYIDLEGDIDHEIAIISGDKSYCVLDLNNIPQCYSGKI